MALSAFQYSCLLFSMCNAYAEIGIFILMYLVCLRRHIPIDLPVWPTYELLQVLHFNLLVYMPLEFILFSGILSRSWLYMVLFVRKAIFKLVFLNNLVYEWGAWDGIVVKALLVGRSWDQFPEVSLDFSVTYFLLTTPWPWGQLSP
jgi:hypothetical protein